MRQGQQHRRGRGRHNNNHNNNNNRKAQNPLTRSFESNGPDVKVRGTPAHIAEKYMSLARDAASGGDPVLSENYLQHAEHYNRIILAYREQQNPQSGGGDGMNGHNPNQRFRSEQAGEGEEFSAGFEEGGDDFGQGEQPVVQRFPHENGRSHEQPYRGERGDAPRHEQPRHEGYRYDDGRPQRQPYDQQPRYRDRHDRRDRYDRNDRHDRSDRGDRGERGDRPERLDRQDRMERPDRGESRFDRGDRMDRGDRDRGPAERERPFDRERPSLTVVADAGETQIRPDVAADVPRDAPEVPAADAPAPASRSEGGPRRRERYAQQGHEQPEFLRRPVRRTRREAAEPQAETVPPTTEEPSE
jgi:hypothetical protein